MTEQIRTETRPEAPTPPTEAAPEVPTEAASVAAASAPAPKKSRRPLLRGIVRWTAALLVCGGVGAGAAMGITAMERTDVPGLATESDGRWEYPKLALPALPAGAPRPFSDGNEAEVHHADLRKLLLPAPAGATVDRKLTGGWVGLDAYLAELKPEDRPELKAFVTDSALRHVAARGWTMPDGSTTRIHLLRFSSVAFSEAYKDEIVGGFFRGERLPVGVEAAELDTFHQGIDVPDVSFYSYKEKEPYGPTQTRWTLIQAGDTVGVVTQTRKGGTLTVPFHQTVTLQAQLLG
ncbi:hypothetical protein HHL19_09655 [Streptomyces sp. R302]|uniref:hypothetical protein n=1 Tax=unclassified Streptomyces TaxID=2593676 RepID=UPI00145E190A|nr:MULTISPECIES: hypothetical protein [unclassified Streptomyces]NML49936.1 hypothetical protein [Streptomyces sp. R301]NML78927.1 hypothetical protein [Streptomyces sp. R302]